VTEILRFQAQQPKSLWSNFRDLNSDEVLTAGQLFDRVYSGGYHLTFQTCITAEGDVNWGRMFIIAMPLPWPASHVFPQEIHTSVAFL
jgi:hypothetical protein